MAGGSGWDPKTGKVGWDVVLQMRVGAILQQVGMGGTLYSRCEWAELCMTSGNGRDFEMTSGNG